MFYILIRPIINVFDYTTLVEIISRKNHKSFTKFHRIFALFKGVTADWYYVGKSH